MWCTQKNDEGAETSHIIRTSKPPRQNVTKQELLALSSLRKNEQLIVLPADKGNATVVMDNTDYRNKIPGLLEDGTYRNIRYPTARIKKTIADLIKSSTSIPEDKKKSFSFGS